MPTLVNTTGNSRLFLVDTASYSVHLSTNLARQVSKVYNDDYTILRRNWLLSDISNDMGTDVSGILGFSLLWLLNLKIDYRDGLIGFAYDPNRFH